MPERMEGEEKQGDTLDQVMGREKERWEKRKDGDNLSSHCFRTVDRALPFTVEGECEIKE